MFYNIIYSCDERILQYTFQDSYIYYYALCIYLLWREVQTTDTVGVASGLGEAFTEQK